MSVDWNPLPESSTDPDAPISQEFVVYRHKLTGDALNSSPTIYMRTENLEQFHDFSKTHLQIRCRIQDNTGATNIIDTAMVENAFSVFRQMRLNLNGVMIEQVEFPSYSTLVNLLQDASASYIRKVGSGYGYYPHIEDAVVGAIPTWTHANPATDGENQENLIQLADLVAGLGENTPERNLADTSFQRRLKRAVSGANTQWMEFMLPLSHVFGCLKNIPITRGQMLELELVRNDTDYVLESNGPVAVATRRLYLDECNLWCQQLTPSFSSLAKIEKVLVSNKSSIWSFPSTTCDIFRNLNTDNQTEHTVRMTSSFTRPMKFFVMFLEERQLSRPAVEGIGWRNPYVFSTLEDKLRRIQLRVNGIQFPREEYDTDFTQNKYSRAYLEFLEMEHLAEDEDSDAPVSYAKYKSEYPIFCFNTAGILADRAYDNVSQHDIEIKFSLSATTTPLALGPPPTGYGKTHMVVVSMHEKRFEVLASNGRLALKSQ